MSFSCRWTFFIGIGLVFLNLQRASAEPNVQTEKPAVTKSNPLAAIQEMSLQEKVGQLLFVGISDTKLSERTAKDLREIQPGAVILFKRNIVNLKQTIKLTHDLRSISRSYAQLPLLIATDQEGGRVARIEFTPSMPSPLALGMTKDAKIVESVSFEAGKFMRYLGFNMNLAPVLDVLLDGRSSFIGERSFGASPKLVGDLGLAFAQGQLRAGIIPTSKHFPGAGLLTQDPHVQKVQTGPFADDVLLPFKQFATVYPSAVMLSHSSYPSIDDSGLPATFSSKIVTDLLIRTLDYKGLIITDDLQMGAVKLLGPDDLGKVTVGDLAVKSFLAGADLLMVTWGPKEQKQAKAALIHAVESGKISLSDLDARIVKIAKIKSLVAPLVRVPASVDNQNSFESKNLANLDDKILSINLTRELKRFEKPTPNERYVVISRTPQFRWAFERALGRSVAAMESQDFLKLNSGSEAEKKFLADYDCVVFPINSRKDAVFLNSLSKELRQKTIVLNLTSPGLIDANGLRGLVNLFHPHANAGRFLGESFRAPAAQPAQQK